MTILEQAVSFIGKELDPDTYYVVYNVSKDNLTNATIFQGTLLNAAHLKQLFSNFEDDLKNYVIVPVITNSRDMDFTQAISFPYFIGT